MLAGPQVQPWTCQNGAVDPQCNAPRPTATSTSPRSGQLEPYDPSNPPPDVANTTTDQGVTVPFIVRIETGYQDRDQYQIAMLYQPGQAVDGRAPQPQWNHKLLITHGASCGIDHQSGTLRRTATPTDGATPSARLRRDVHGARQRRPQLQPRHRRPSR